MLRENLWKRRLLGLNWWIDSTAHAQNASFKRQAYFWKGLIQIEDEVQKGLTESHKKLLLDTSHVNLQTSSYHKVHDQRITNFPVCVLLRTSKRKPLVCHTFGMLQLIFTLLYSYVMQFYNSVNFGPKSNAFKQVYRANVPRYSSTITKVRTKLLRNDKHPSVIAFPIMITGIFISR